MVLPIEFLLDATRLIALGVAAWLTITAYRAYLRTGQPAFGYTTAGFALLGFGVLVESLLWQLGSLTLPEIHTLESVVFALGFLVLGRSFVGRA